MVEGWRWFRSSDPVSLGDRTARDRKIVVPSAAAPLIAMPPHRLSAVAAAWAEDLQR